MDNQPPEIKYQQPGALDHEKAKSWFSMHKVLAYILLGLLILAGVGVGLYYKIDSSIPEKVPYGGHHVKSGLVYTNDQYGFSIDLPQSWVGYAVLNSQWEGRG